MVEAIPRRGWSWCTKHPLQCARCSGVINVGDVYQWSNLDRKARHVADERGACDVAWRPQQGDSANNNGTEPERAPRATAAAGSIDALIDARIDARLDGFEPEHALDVDAVRALIRDAITDSALTVRIEHKPYEPVTVQ